MTQTGRLVRSSAETPRKIPVRFGRATHYDSRSGGFQEPVSNVPSPVRRSGSTSFRRTPEPANPSFRRRPEPRGVGGTPSVAHEVEPSTLDNRRPMQKPQPATPVIPDPDRGSRRKPDPPIRRSGEGRNLGVWATTPVVQGSAGPCSRQNLATQPSKISSWAPQCHTEHPDVIPSTPMSFRAKPRNLSLRLAVAAPFMQQGLALRRSLLVVIPAPEPESRGWGTWIPAFAERLDRGALQPVFIVTIRNTHFRLLQANGPPLQVASYSRGRGGPD